jgi:hypothetical protein
MVMFGRFIGWLIIIGFACFVGMVIYAVLVVLYTIWESIYERHKDSHFLSVWRHRHD